MQRFRKAKKGMQTVTLLLVFSMLLAGFSTNTMISKAAAKGKKELPVIVSAVIPLIMMGKVLSSYSGQCKSKPQVYPFCYNIFSGRFAFV